jgi:V/A-type H+-transporting ATPase subunit F
MTRMVFVTPEEVRYGFGLGGASQQLATAAGIEATLLQLFAEPEVGVVVVDERLLAGIADARLKVLEERWSGLLLVLPAPATGAAVGPDFVRRLLRRVLGYQVRLE